MHPLLVNRPGASREALGKDVEAGLADVVPVGQMALANPDLVHRSTQQTGPHSMAAPKLDTQTIRRWRRKGTANRLEGAARAGRSLRPHLSIDGIERCRRQRAFAAGMIENLESEVGADATMRAFLAFSAELKKHHQSIAATMVSGDLRPFEKVCHSLSAAPGRWAPSSWEGSPANLRRDARQIRRGRPSRVRPS